MGICTHTLILCLNLLILVVSIKLSDNHRLRLALQGAHPAVYATGFRYAERAFDDALDCVGRAVPLAKRTADALGLVDMHAHYPPVPRGRRYAHRRAGLGTLSATHALFLVYGKVISVVLVLFRHRAEKTDVLAESAVNAFFLIDTIRHFLPRHIQVSINR